MQKKYRLYLFSFLALASLIAGIFGANFAFAKQQHVSSANTSRALGKAFNTGSVTPHVVNMSNVPAATAKQVHQKQNLMPFLYPGGSAKYASLKAGAAHNSAAPAVAHPLTNTKVSPTTPPAIANFAGMADSGTICPYFGTGCQPPDMALATSNQWVLQHVNTSVAVYNTSGAIQPGWPKNSQNFFGIPESVPQRLRSRWPVPERPACVLRS